MLKVYWRATIKILTNSTLQSPGLQVRSRSGILKEKTMGYKSIMYCSTVHPQWWWTKTCWFKDWTQFERTNHYIIKVAKVTKLKTRIGFVIFFQINFVIGISWLKTLDTGIILSLKISLFLGGFSIHKMISKREGYLVLQSNSSLHLGLSKMFRN